MENKYNWKIEDIFEDEKAWQKEFDGIGDFKDIEKFKGKLNDKQNFLACMKLIESYSRKIEKLYIYASMKHDENTYSTLGDSLMNKIQMAFVNFSAKTAFITPELTALDQKILENYVLDSDLKNYDYSLKCVLKSKAHVLSEKEETLLANVGEPLSCIKDIFKKIDDADLPLKPFTYGGKKYKLSHGLYSLYLQNEDQNFRKKAFKSYYKGYISLINVISSTYVANVKKDVFYAKAKNFKSALDKALFNEDVDSAVYYNLISAVHKNLPNLHEYIAQKKKSLGVEKMHMYDMNVPAVSNAGLSLEYEDAYALVIEGLSVLGKEYQDLLKKAKEDRWIDVYEKSGKRSGAYSTGVYDTHPYVLLNYQKTTHDVFTIAHEMGHSIHTYFSNKNQPYEKADYKIFVAEVASTVNEVLLINYLLKKEEDKTTKKYLLSYLLEMIRTTLFRQTQFAEFEEFAHKTYEKGTPITKESLTKFYHRLNKKYYGTSVINDKEIGYEWARIPHFYTSFYVYKYATGIISALKIANRILTEGEVAIKDYFKFLSSGSSDGPVELLKIAGVDLTKQETFDGAFEVFKNALNDFTKLN